MASRYAVEVVGYGRAGGLLNFAFQKNDPDRPELDRPVVPSSSVPTEIYNDPIGFALAAVGHPAADPSLVTDDDVEAVPATLYFPFLDLLEYRLIRSAVGNITDTDEVNLDETQSWAKLVDRFQARADKLQVQYASYLSVTSGFVISRPTPGWRTFPIGDGRTWGYF